MPTYEYRCTECGNRLEAMQRMSDAPLTTCPACHKEGLKRVVSGGAGVLYKGEGWYVTDYSKKSSGGKDIPAGSGPSSPAAKKSDTPSSTPSSPNTSSSTDSGSAAKTGS